jgi:Tol biopolymer transport system component
VFNGHDYRQGFEVESVAVVGARGGPTKQLDLGCVDPCVSALPSWAPDGQHLVFTRVVGPFSNDNATSAVPWSARPDGSDLRRISPPGVDDIYEDANARFSPDGSYIVFVRLSVELERAAIFRMKPDGTDAGQLTPWDLTCPTIRRPRAPHARPGHVRDLWTQSDAGWRDAANCDCSGELHVR